jgi:hypothetical protein
MVGSFFCFNEAITRLGNRIEMCLGLEVGISENYPRGMSSTFLYIGASARKIVYSLPPILFIIDMDVSS